MNHVGAGFMAEPAYDMEHSVGVVVCLSMSYHEKNIGIKFKLSEVALYWPES